MPKSGYLAQQLNGKAIKLGDGPYHVELSDVQIKRTVKLVKVPHI